MASYSDWHSLAPIYDLGASDSSGDDVSTNDIIIGAAIIVAGGIAQGLFTAPMKMTKGWEWENHWIMYGISGLLIMPWIIVLSTVPEVPTVYDTKWSYLFVPFVLGFLWGVGGVLFGLGCDMVGNSLGFSIILGMCSALGAAIPLVALHPEDVGSKEGIFTWIGLAIVAIGLVFLAAAGMSKEKELQSMGSVSENMPLINDMREESVEKKPASFKTGLIVCILSGVFSPMLNVAVNFGKHIEDRATNCGASSPTAHNANWAVIVLGGFVMQFTYPVYLLCKNHTWGLFLKGSCGQILLNFFLSSMMGVLWFSGNVMYTFGASKMGSLGTVAGWPMLMVCMVLSANVVAVVTGEWKGTSSKTKMRLVIGLIILVIAAVVGQLGSSNSSSTTTMSPDVNDTTTSTTVNTCGH